MQSFRLTQAMPECCSFDNGDPGTVEEWTVENHTTANHEFHFHQLHFLVESQNNFEINGDSRRRPSPGRIWAWSKFLTG
jgi:FtsP/CotA-like multicopper oxidase with cupredoxin domain